LNQVRIIYHGFVVNKKDEKDEKGWLYFNFNPPPSTSSIYSTAQLGLWFNRDIVNLIRPLEKNHDRGFLAIFDNVLVKFFYRADPDIAQLLADSLHHRVPRGKIIRGSRG
jgi:hypothetical protein